MPAVRAPLPGSRPLSSTIQRGHASMPDALPTDFRVGPRSCLHTLIAYRASQAVADAHALPRTPGAVAISPARARALCIGPAEWFLVNCDPHALALPGEQCAIVEQTGAFA